MVYVIASIRVKENALSEFLPIFKANVPTVRKEEGCVEYSATLDAPTDLSFQTRDPNVVTVVEKWQSVEALEAHLATPHMLEYQTQTEALVESASIQVLQEA